MPKTKTRRDAARHPLDHDPAALRARRVELGLSQIEVAAKVEISSSYLSELERGDRNPSPRLLARLAAALDCATADLMPRRSA